MRTRVCVFVRFDGEMLPMWIKLNKILNEKQKEQRKNNKTIFAPQRAQAFRLTHVCMNLYVLFVYRHFFSHSPLFCLLLFFLVVVVVIRQNVSNISQKVYAMCSTNKHQANRVCIRNGRVLRNRNTTLRPLNVDCYSLALRRFLFRFFSFRTYYFMCGMIIYMIIIILYTASASA